MCSIFKVFLLFFTATSWAQEIKIDKATLGFGALAQMDYTSYFGNSFNKGLSSGAEARRLRFQLKGKIEDQWAYLLQFDFSSNEVTLKDSHISYRLNSHWDFYIGHVFQDSSLESTTSSRDLIFMERPMIYSAWYEDRSYGAYARFVSDSFRATFGVATNNEDESESNDDKTAGEGSTGLVARFVYRPYVSEDSAFHIGYASRFRRYKSTTGDEFDLKSRPAGTHVTDVTLLDTGAILNSKHSLIHVLEFFYTKKRMTLSGEYHLHNVDTKGEDYRFSGYYAQLSYNFGDLARGYDKAKATVARAKGHGYELGLRFDHLDLTSKTIKGGKETDYSLIASWFPNDHLRFSMQATYGDVQYYDAGKEENEEPIALTFRTQFHF